MVWWIVLAVVVTALLILVLSVVPVLRRLPRLVRAAAVLRRRQAEGLALRESAERLRERLESLQVQVERTSTGTSANLAVPKPGRRT